MIDSCLLEDVAHTTPITPAPSLTSEELIKTAETVAPGVFFLRGATRYSEEGAKTGSAGAIQSLMCNNGWIDLGDEVRLIDANIPGRVDTLLAHVHATTAKPIRYLVNSHHHGDHIYGNRRIHDLTGAVVIACMEMVEELGRYEPGRWEQVSKLRPDVAATPILAPTITFDRRLVIEGSARRVELLHVTWGHPLGDTAVWMPGAGVLFTGDLVANGPYNIVRDGEMRTWPSFLTALEVLGPTVLCPGQGDRAGPDLLSRQRTFFEALWSQVAARARVGRSLAEVHSNLDAIRAGLIADPSAAFHVIPREADLPVLSLAAQVERGFGQMETNP